MSLLIFTSQLIFISEDFSLVLALFRVSAFLVHIVLRYLVIPILCSEAVGGLCEELLYPRQHGFFNERSCITQMVPFTYDLALTLNEKSKSDVIYFDFAKTFDRVSHDLILKLKKTQKYL